MVARSTARAEPRLTRDADLAVVVNDDHDAETLVLELRSAGYDVAASVEQEATGRLATIRLLPRNPTEQLVTDLLFASSGIEEEIVTAADDIVVFAGLSVPVATVGHLMAMKLLARDDRRRPADADDLRALAGVAQSDHRPGTEPRAPQRRHHKTVSRPCSRVHNPGSPSLLLPAPGDSLAD